MKTNYQRVDSKGYKPPRDLANPEHGKAAERYVGIDMGTESLKMIELTKDGGVFHCGRRVRVEHGKSPGPILKEILGKWDWETVRGAAACGRLSRQVNLMRVPAKQAQVQAYRFHFHHSPATVVSIGSHGFSVLELRARGVEVFRENNRCSQGTGNFLRQLVERFSLTIEEASELCAGVGQSAPLSGRCPVILKTDMTHLANKGENRVRILAGLFDAVCENVLNLIKPGTSPAKVLLIGGVSRSRRVQDRFRQFLEQNQMSLLSLEEEDALFFEAIGSAIAASQHPQDIPPLDQLFVPATGAKLEKLPALSQHLDRVQRMKGPPLALINGESRDVVLGFDIGSTGSKAIALDCSTREILWEGYRQTSGDPVGAAQALLRQWAEAPAGHCRFRSVGVTGSGREIVGSLMTTCYGKEAVFILNEIAAHAAGAQHYDPRVDTIFEIGGQDAKYIRLAGGRVIDCAMNEACSAGTGSFIEEQGRKFSEIRHVVQLSQEALASDSGVSLGQHCSVFMAEIIDEAVAAGVSQRAIIAGLYDSIIQNYLHRVKGSRSVGQVIFCQGMPFASDALAAAVARQTGSQVIVPPNPGTVGALGIALITLREIHWRIRRPLQAALFLDAHIEQKETFVCKSTTGCGGPGNRCRIDCLKTIVAGQHQRFTWGGGCSLHDKGTRKVKLPDLSPNPFREREDLLKETVQPFLKGRGGRRVALSDEFMLKSLFPFFSAFLYELGLDLVVQGEGDQATLKRGIQGANVPFCAPMQLFHGLASLMAKADTDFVFIPMIRSVPRLGTEDCSATCPVVQASPEVIRWDLGGDAAGTILSPVIDLERGNLESKEFLRSCRRLAADLGVNPARWKRAHQFACEVQNRFDQACAELGRRAMEFCRARGIAPVVVLGRPYTIYNTVLNSNVPAILREQGAVAIPLDCYSIDPTLPPFKGMYWGYGHRILQAAHQIRRSPGVYSLYCSNYSCGPDSFNLHFYSYVMEGKPFAIIETDGHSGDAGTKTRVEAFLHCVQEDRRIAASHPLTDFQHVGTEGVTLGSIRQNDERLLIPWMGPGSEPVTACMRGLGIRAETLPMPDLETLRIGRRHTSGKECLPACLTLGALIKRIQAEPNPNEL
ncbi:MAG: acyl-CoA dehydratase activase-related protein, partial [Candidatus Omnitrophica bacterium]|nr:acyl-CoA dehydratase activase-related protein [Candidatus Omnitrophota bacterium]